MGGYKRYMSMKTIILIGEANTGKSRAIFEVVKTLWNINPTYEVIGAISSPELFDGKGYAPNHSDLVTVFDVNGKRVLFVSATDDSECINRLKNTLDELAQKRYSIDILVTSCRRFDSEQFNLMVKTMNWNVRGRLLYDSGNEEIIQIPLLSVKYESAYNDVVDWYNLLSANLLTNVVLNELK